MILKSFSSDKDYCTAAFTVQYSSIILVVCK